MVRVISYPSEKQFLSLLDGGVTLNGNGNSVYIKRNGERLTCEEKSLTRRIRYTMSYRELKAELIGRWRYHELKGDTYGILRSIQAQHGRLCGAVGEPCTEESGAKEVRKGKGRKKV